MWEAKVIATAAADANADSDAAAETNWKHKVTPDRGDLIIGAPSGALHFGVNILQFEYFCPKVCIPNN